LGRASPYSPHIGAETAVQQTNNMKLLKGDNSKQENILAVLDFLSFYGIEWANFPKLVVANY